MSIYSRLRRTEINEGDIYKANKLFGSINEDFDAREFLFVDKIPHEYRLYDPHTPVEPIRDIKKLCERDLSKMSRGSDDDIEISSADELEPDDNIGSTYCSLYNVYQHIDGGQRKEEFIDNLSRVFWFIRPNIYDNRVKFHNVMRLLLRGDHDHVFESIKTLSDRIKSTYNEGASDGEGFESQDIKNVLDRLRGKSSLSVDELRQQLNSAKFQAYTIYEKSFTKGPFIRTSKVFRLKYKEGIAEKGFRHILDIAYNKIYNSQFISKGDQEQFNEVINEASQKLYDAVLDLYDEGQASKADLIAEADIKDINGGIVIHKGGLVEVKMRDYKTDSYLSEFFSIYKDANINPKYKTPEMLEIYNATIESLYMKMKNNDGGIISDIRENFYGIFFGEKEYNGKMMPVYIPSDQIDLYWSNQGKVLSTRQKRLSIRYNVKDLTTIFYYDRSNNTMIPSNVSESFDLGGIKSVLIEGRKENAREKYPDVPESIYNLFVNLDPSGNHKYIDWLMKNTTNIYDKANDLMSDVIYFHKHPELYVHRDINKYDAGALVLDTLVAKKKYEEREKEREAKKQRDIIYKDDRWLVVSPKTHVASCYYGAGTKWCITAKTTGTHWERYSRNSSFFFIIDNTKNSKDRLYKVAYRLVGRHARLELWDAEDFEFSKQPRGKEYVSELPPKLLENIMSYHREKYPEGSDEREAWIDNDPQAQALVNHLDHFEVDSEEDWWLGMSVYVDTIENEWYCIGNEDQVDDAVYEIYDDYTDGDLIEYYDPDGDFVEFDEEDFIDVELESINEQYGVNEMLEIQGNDEEYTEISNRIERLEAGLSELDGDSALEVESKISELEGQKRDLVEQSYEEYAEYIKDDWERCFRRGPVYCLVNEKGWYRDVHEMYKNDVIQLDRHSLIRDLVENADWEMVGGYGWHESQDDDGNTYYIFKVDY